MKKQIIFIAVSMAVLSNSANATIFGGASSYDKQQDTKISALQDRDAQLAADIHQVHINTLGKYSESWGLEDRANIAKLQEEKLDKTTFAADQARQDKALADSVTKQAATDAKQTTDLKNYADAKATSAYQTSVAHTDSKVARADADRAKGDQELSDRIDAGTAAQAVRDAEQDDHINAVQGAAQTANDRASNLEVRADAAEGAILNTQSAAQTANDRATALETRADGTEQAIRSESQTRAQQVVQLAAGVDHAQATGDYAAARADQAYYNASLNSQAIRRTNEQVAANSAKLADHEQRIGNLEQSTNRAFADMKGKIDRVERKANAGTAAALSSAAIPQVTEYQRFALGAGLGGYESESALAVGFSSRVSSAVVIKASVTTDSQHGFGYNAGVSLGW